MFSMWRGKIAIESWNEWGENANEVDCIKTDCLYMAILILFILFSRNGIQYYSGEKYLTTWQSQLMEGQKF